jgi:hypothetical protein
MRAAYEPRATKKHPAGYEIVTTASVEVRDGNLTPAADFPPYFSPLQDTL